jgi:hypothetical protein
MRMYNGCQRLCSCGKETCIAILGYCGEGSFQLPTGQKPDKSNLRKQWCQALGIGQKDILAGEKILRIAYWHFPERFRHFDEKVGAWKQRPRINGSITRGRNGWVLFPFVTLMSSSPPIFPRDMNQPFVSLQSSRQCRNRDRLLFRQAPLVAYCMRPTVLCPRILH